MGSSVPIAPQVVTVVSSSPNWNASGQQSPGSLRSLGRHVEVHERLTVQVHLEAEAGKRGTHVLDAHRVNIRIKFDVDVVASDEAVDGRIVSDKCCV